MTLPEMIERRDALLAEAYALQMEIFKATRMPTFIWMSEREQQVAEMLKAGCTDQEICRKLRISQSTVGFHVSNILRKHNCKKRSQLL